MSAAATRSYSYPPGTLNHRLWVGSHSARSYALGLVLDFLLVFIMFYAWDGSPFFYLWVAMMLVIIAITVWRGVAISRIYNRLIALHYPIEFHQAATIYFSGWAYEKLPTYEELLQISTSDDQLIDFLQRT